MATRSCFTCFASPVDPLHYLKCIKKIDSMGHVLVTGHAVPGSLRAIYRGKLPEPPPEESIKCANNVVVGSVWYTKGEEQKDFGHVVDLMEKLPKDSIKFIVLHVMNFRRGLRLSGFCRTGVSQRLIQHFVGDG